MCDVSRKHMEQKISHIYPDDLELLLNSTSILMNAEKKSAFFFFFLIVIYDIHGTESKPTRPETISWSSFK